jgi:hypothetical protein
MMGRQGDEVNAVHADEIRLDIKGPHGFIDPRALAEGITHLVALLDHLELPEGDEKPEWTLSGLHISSAQADMRGSSSSAAIATDGLEALAHKPGIPAGWTIGAVQEVVKLGKVRKRRGVEDLLIAVERATLAIDEVLLANARESLKPWPMSLGSIQGRLFRYNDDEREAGVLDEVTMHRVKITVPREHSDQVAGALLRDVCVWGELHHTPTGRIDHLAMEGLELLPEPANPAPISELADILGEDWTNGLDAVEAVRRQRG